MVTSLHSIALPPIAGDDDSLTWDMSIADIPSIDTDDEDDISVTADNRTSLTHHAVAHGRCVVGTLPSLTADDPIITWQTTQFDNQVVAVSSNDDGSVVASATKSHVSLIKGGDGSLLATRQIASEKIRTSSPSPGVVFVSRPPNLTAVPDALVVFRPSESSNTTSDVILISNIDGRELNSLHLNRVREAVQEMSIDALTLSPMQVSSVSGVYVNEETIRFFVAGAGKVVVYDHNVTDMKTVLVVDNLLDLMPGEWRYDNSMEMVIDDYSDTRTYLSIALSNEMGQHEIFWFDTLDLSVSAKYSCNCTIRSFKPVRSCIPEKCVAAVIATKDDDSKIHVVQSVIKGDGIPSKDSDSMILFTIKIADSRTQSVEFATGISKREKSPYAFRFLAKKSSDTENTVVDFDSGEQQETGMVHYLLTNNAFDDAHMLVLKMEEHQSNNMVSSSIHKSLVAVWQFRHVLLKGNIASKENIIEAKECLRRLASSAISGGEKGVEGLVDAATFIMNWPKNHAADSNFVPESRTISIQEVCMALSAMSTCIASVVEVLNTSKVVKLQEMQQKLDERQTALRGLRSIAEVDGLPLTFDDPYLAISSLNDLLNCLVSQGAFKSTERLMKSHWGKNIPSDVVASSVLRIPASADPRSFLPWLCDLILPTLSIGDPMLETIRAWSCGAADTYDEENGSSGLENAIMLLQAVSRATSRLTIAMNNSFAHNTQLETNDEDEVPETPRHNGSSFSFDSKVSRSTVNRPTVLNIGMISGMKSKSGKVFSAKRVGRPSAPVSTDILFPSSSTSNIPVDDELEYDCVENKLNEAMRLKAARYLGIQRECLTLKNYSNEGEQYIVKQLIKVTLNLVVATEEDVTNEGVSVDKIRLYAKEVNANFDDAVHQYAIELCDSSRDNIPNILKQAEKICRWCSSPPIRCLIVLKMLRKALVSIQRPPDLSGLACDALNWVTDENVKSELDEGVRLLSIDSLVRKYCGNGAQEFFRVNESSHSIRLVQHVCRHIDAEDVISDILVLCDAFNASVNKVDVCVDFIQRVMAAESKTIKGSTLSRADHVANIMEELSLKDHTLAERVGERIIAFCSEIIEDTCRMIRQNLCPTRAKQQAVSASLTALSTIRANNATQKARHACQSSPTLLKEFQRLSNLQIECDVFITLSELRNPSSCVVVLLDLLSPCIDLLHGNSLIFVDSSVKEKLRSIIASAKHWCAILSDTPSNLWSRSIGMIASQVAETTENHSSLLLLDASGVFDDRSGQSSFHSVISVALTLTGRAVSEACKLSKSISFMSNDAGLSSTLTAMKSIAQASLILRNHIILYSPPSMLPSSMTLANMTEFVCDVSTRADLGIGEKLEAYISLLQAGSRKNRDHLLSSKALLHDKKDLPTAPIIHASWYIGDGLMLRPIETLILSMTTCETMLVLESNRTNDPNHVTRSTIETFDFIHMLESRGANSTALRLISIADSIALSRNTSHHVTNRIESITAALAERTLGGVESGLTSGTIDYLSTVFLTGNLPKEKAFNIYQSALPSAIGKRDFSRILTLASIGMYCGKGRYSSGEPFPWSKQKKFIDQCCSLVTNAKMWSILSKYTVSFDPAVFTQSEDLSLASLQQYCESLIRNAASQLDQESYVESALLLANKFTKQYSLNKHVPASLLIQFLLSSPNEEMSDIRRNLKQVEEAVRQICLPLLPLVNQSKVLRKCVMSLEESSVKSSADYERHSMVLMLYKGCLDRLGTYMTTETRRKAHNQESQLIERRLNAVILLSTIFDDKYSPEEKPHFSRLFEPLPGDPSQISNSNQRKHSVLHHDSSQNAFDPLAALHDALAMDAMTASLSPLCSILGLPSGHIHARALIVKFRKMKQLGEALPPPQSSIIVVAKKLATASDRAELSWWCSSFYDNAPYEQLQCLELAYTNALLASEQIESSTTGIDTEDQRYAIDRVRRIDLKRSLLSDQLVVNDALTRNPCTPEKVKSVYKSIIHKVHGTIRHNSDKYTPENLVKGLLVEGSMVAAEASLDSNDAFTTTHFRSLAILVHDACRMLSTRYSHINIGRCARVVTRRWLVHGDEVNNGTVADTFEASIDDSKFCSDETLKPINEDSEATSEFVMDIGGMNISSGNHVWSHQTSSVTATVIKSSSEPSVFGSLSCRRELSDLNNSRAALRIAFLMCFAQDYHLRFDSHEDETSFEDREENIDANVTTTTTKDTKLRAKLLKTRQKANCFEGDLALSHAQELLGIVFAKQGCTEASTFVSMLEDSHDGSYATHDGERRTKNIALSFAMRYRALKVASILCPHDVLVRVMLEQGYSNDFDDDCVEKFAFGSFLSMEIEAMGLALPHSDLAQLSTMHFPSYGRTLWRNHGRFSAASLSGRLHLLVLELSLNHHDTVDWDLLMSMYNEIMKHGLPRSLLLACECAIQYRAIERAAALGKKDVIVCINDAATKLFEFMSLEIQADSESKNLKVSACSSTVDRVLRIIDSLETADAIYFAEAFTSLGIDLKEQGRQDWYEVMATAAVHIASHISDPQSFSELSPVTKSMYQNTKGTNSQSLAPISSVSSVCDSIEMSFFMHTN